MAPKASDGAGHNHFQRDVAWQSLCALALAAAVSGALCICAAVRADGFFRGMGGRVDRLPDGVGVKAYLRTQGLAGAEAFASDGKIRIATSVTQTWLLKLLYQGPIPYFIVASGLMGLFYVVFIVLRRMVPTGYGVFQMRRDVENVKEFIVDSGGHGVNALEEVVQRARLCAGGRMAARLQSLAVLQGRGMDSTALREANSSYSDVEQGQAATVLMPMVFTEWILPIFGFIGTVVGVTMAVGGLRDGINALFAAQQLTAEVRSRFMLGFTGLVLAFDTTLYGLVGLAIIGPIHLLLRRSALAVVVTVDKWTNEVIGVLKEQPSQIERLLRDILRTLAETTQGRLAEKDGKPIPRWKADFEGLGKALKDGLLTEDGGQPAPWLGQLSALLKQGLLQPEQGGAASPILGRLREILEGGLYSENRPALTRVISLLEAMAKDVSHLPYPIRQVYMALMREFYDLVGIDEGDRVVPLTLIHENGEEEEVEGRRRADRRHGEMLRWVAEVARRIGEQPSEGGGAGPDPRGRRIVEPASAAVSALAIGDDRLALTANQDGSSSTLRAGRIEMVGGEPVANLLETAHVSPGVTAMRFSGDSLVTERAKAGQAEVRRFGAGLAVLSQAVVPGGCTVIPRLLGVFDGGGTPYLSLVAKTGGKSQLFACPMDGSRPVGRLSVPMDEVVAVTAVNGGLACAIRTGGSSIIRLIQSPTKFTDVKVDDAVSCVTAGPGGVLWFAGRSSLGTVDFAVKKCVPLPTGVSCPPAGIVAAGAEVAFYEPEGCVLHVVRPDGGRMKVEYPATITALAGAGQPAMLVGLADGSVFYRRVQ